MAPGPPSSSNDYLMNTRTSSASRPNTFASSSADPSSRPPRIPTRREGFEVALDGVLHSHVEGGEESDRLLQNEGEGGNERGREVRVLETWKVMSSFFGFGLINNVLYVIILSAALDLVPSATPKGVIAFFNIFPALLAKVGWPYIFKGQIRYYLRVFSCATCSFLGMMIIAFFPYLPLRLLGISLASFSSGLGELSFLQLSTSYHPSQSLGGFASGTGAAGIVGAGLWILLKGLGVRVGLGLMGIVPWGMVLLLWGVLRLGRDGGQAIVETARRASYDGDEVPKSSGVVAVDGLTSSGLKPREKWALARPLLLPFMLPLFCVYVFEYVINSGITPTLLYPLPPPGSLLSWFIKSPRDFYPLYALTYQTFVFISRSSHLLRIPPLPRSLLPLPAILQAVVLTLLLLESTRSNGNGGFGFLQVGGVLLLICVEGCCGGSAYVNTFHHVGLEGLGSENIAGKDERKRVEEREFRIASVGAADSLGILFASLLSMPLELAICQTQVDVGRDLCRTL